MPDALTQWAAFWSLQELFWKNLQAIAPPGNLTRPLARVKPAGLAPPPPLEGLPTLSAPAHQNTTPIIHTALS